MHQMMCTFPAVLFSTRNRPIDNIKLRAFGDASIHGVCAAVSAVVTQASGVTRVLIAAKSDSSFEARVVVVVVVVVDDHLYLNSVKNLQLY